VTNLVFFYGTLMTGFKRRGRSRIEAKLAPEGRGSISAALFDLGIYPAAVPSSDSQVFGEVHRMLDVDSVLEASATRYAEGWPQSFGDVRFAGSEEGAAQQLLALDTTPAFASGQLGAWRPKESYVYVAPRNQSNPINLRRDGTFNGVALFDWSSDLALTCAPNWKLTGEVTRYNPYGHTTERRNILGAFTASLFGFHFSHNFSSLVRPCWRTGC